MELLVLEFQPPHRARACGFDLAAQPEGFSVVVPRALDVRHGPNPQRLATNSLGFKIHNKQGLHGLRCARP